LKIQALMKLAWWVFTWSS